MYKLVNENSIKSIADAIRIKTNTIESLTFPTDFINAIQNISGSGYTINDLATRAISGAIIGGVTSISSYAFYHYDNLTNISFPNCTYIGNYAFYSCSSLASISFPVCTTIGDSTFQYCNALTSIYLSQVTAIGSNAFYYCRSLASVSLPQVKTIGSYAFGYCSSLTSIKLPQATSIGEDGFTNCRSLTSVNLPKVTSVGTYAFATCRSLISINLPQVTSIERYTFASCVSLAAINLPQVTTIGSSTFAFCSSLTSVSLPQVTIISNYAFYYCFHLLSVCLLGSSIATLASISAFYSTPISTYTTSTSGVYGSIYVPVSLYSSYIIASNWSVYSARIVGVSTITINYFNDAYGEDYLYEPSMTWADWVNSKYNTAGFYASNGHVNFDDSIDGSQQWLEDYMGENISLSENIVDTNANNDDNSCYIGAYTSKSGFDVDNGSGAAYFIYEIDMTWAEWVNSIYNTVDFVVDPETSYIGVKDYEENTYIYLTEFDDTTINIISTHKIIDYMKNKLNNSFKINTQL